MFCALYIYLLLASTVLSGVCGFLLGSQIVSCFLTAVLFISLILNTACLYNVVILRDIVYIDLYRWLDLETLSVEFGLYFDSLSTIMCEIILIISLLVHLYSLDYMKHDPHKLRFFVFLSFFTWFMLVMVLSDNIIQFFMAWEGVGVMSYLLIGFWFTRVEASRSALKALIVNKISDIAFYCAIFMIFVNTNIVSFINFNSTCLIELNVGPYSFESIMFLLLIAAFGKSAQLGLHVWLPDAMEGPTPVSALLHAATMVTAGVFLLLRVSPVLDQFPPCLTFCAIVGSLTAMFSAIIGSLQNDIKKIIAYSTCSQLGYMFMAVGTTNYSGAFFHLVNHAFFKALLFLGAGVLIHVFNNQDLRRFGRLYSKDPAIHYEHRLLSLLIILGNLSLVGFIYMSGAYSKDYILEYALVSGHSFCRFAGLITVAFTTFYSVRLVYKSLIAVPSRFSRSLVTNAPALPITWASWVPLCVLGIFSIFSGYVLKDAFIGLGSDVFTDSLPLSRERFEQDSEYLSVCAKQLPFIIILIVSSVTWVCYKYINLSNKKLLYFFLLALPVIKVILTFVVKEHCGFNRVYYSLAHPVMLFIHKILFKEVERGLLESLSYYWILHVLKISMLKVKQTQFGSVLVYILVFVTTSIFSALIFINLGVPTLFAYLIAVTFFSNLVYLTIKKIQFIQFFFNWWCRLIKWLKELWKKMGGGDSTNKS